MAGVVTRERASGEMGVAASVVTWPSSSIGSSSSGSGGMPPLGHVPSRIHPACNIFIWLMG